MYDILPINIKEIQKNNVVQPTWDIGYGYYVLQKFLTYAFTYILAMDPVLMQPDSLLHFDRLVSAD